jgi:predicted ATPase/class 3 adenylate cyclase
MDRRLALARGQDLPDKAYGTALFADIVGFTPLTEALAGKFGRRAGAEELTRQLTTIFGAMISAVHHYQGSVIGFSGDAVTSWFEGDGALRATACGLVMQRAIHGLKGTGTPESGLTSMAMKVGVATGTVRRFRVGNPLIQYIDVLAGSTLDRLAAAERQARQGEVVLDPAAIAEVGDRVDVTEWQIDDSDGPDVEPQAFGVVVDVAAGLHVTSWPGSLPGHKPTRVDWRLTEAQMRPWLLPPVYGRLRSGQGYFLDEIRPAAALFLRFGGLNYDTDASAGEKLDAYIQWVQGVLTRYTGYLIQLTTGDKGSYLYAAFGAPVALEDFSERALAASLELRTPPTEMTFINSVQIGLSQGLMYAGAYGSPVRRTYGVLGNETNVAARLMGQANPGQVLITGRVARAIGQNYQLRSLPPVALKGKAAPVPVFEVLRRRWLVVKKDELRPSTAMVGRRTERADLAQMLQQVLDAGAGQVVIIEGEAGIGKSRLAAELTAWVRERGLAELLGAGQSIEWQTPYRAWRDIFMLYFNLVPGIDASTSSTNTAHAKLVRQTRVKNRVQAVAPDQVDRLPLLNDVLDLDLPDTELTASLDPATRQRGLVSLLVTLLRAWSRDQPLILVLEDAQWLDSLSWELAIHVARALVASSDPLMLVVVTRTAEEDSFAGRQMARLRALAETSTICLSPLGQQEIVSLAASRLDLPSRNLPKPIAELICQRAGGNPFFAEELILALIEHGLIATEPDHHQTGQSGGNGFSNRCLITGDLDQARRTLPDTLQSLILARIDRLPPGPQLTLKVGAVIGRTFGYTPLHHTLNRHVSLKKSSLKRYLAILMNSNLTSIENRKPDLTYMFNHIITQQVTYQTLLVQQRQRLHRTIAEWYEEVFKVNGETLSPKKLSGSSFILPLIAFHYREAAEPERERCFARLAGEQAAAQFANEEAVAYLSRALQLTPEADYAERYTLLLAREKIHGLQGQRDAQMQVLQTLESLARALNDDLKLAELSLRHSDFAEATGDYAAAIEAAQHAIELVQAAHDITMEARGYLAWGRALWRQGNYEAAQSQLTRSLELAGAAPQLKAHCLRTLGLVAWNQGAYDEARSHFEQTLLIFQESGDRRGEGLVLNNLGIISAETGDHLQAVSYFEQALLVCRHIGDREVEGNVLNNLGIVAGRQSNYVNAKSRYERALLIMREIGDRHGQAMVMDNLGDVFRYEGDFAGATTYFEQSLRIRRDIGDRRGEANILNNLGNIRHYQGDYQEARAYYERALEIRRQIGEQQGEGETFAYLGLLFHHLGDDKKAVAYSEQSADIARELGDHHLLGFALTHLGHALAGQERLADAENTYQQAVSVRRELGEYNRALEPLAGLIRIYLDLDMRSAAQAWVEEILGHIEGRQLHGTEEPLRIYLTCYRFLEAGQDPRALAVLTQAHDLLQTQAEMLVDVTLQRSFLENVAAHREIDLAWRRQNQDQPV